MNMVMMMMMITMRMMMAVMMTMMATIGFLWRVSGGGSNASHGYPTPT